METINNQKYKFLTIVNKMLATFIVLTSLILILGVSYTAFNTKKTNQKESIIENEYKENMNNIWFSDIDEEEKTPEINSLVAIHDFDALPKKDEYFLGGLIKREEVEEIIFIDNNIPSIEASGSWDVSSNKDGSIMAWYENGSADGLYKLYIGQGGGVIANHDSSWLFAMLVNLKRIDVNNFITSNVTNMEGMFAGTGSYSDEIILDLNTFDTSNVTNMANMFDSTGAYSASLEININSFNLADNADTSHMFKNMGLNAQVISAEISSNIKNSPSINLPENIIVK